MLRRSPLLLVVVLVAGCGGKDKPAVVASASVPALQGAQAQPSAPAVSAATARIADVPAARERLGFVDLTRAATAAPVLTRDELVRTVLGEGAARVRADAAGSALQLGGATVLVGSGLPADGVAAGRDGRVLGGNATLVRALQNPKPVPSIAILRGQGVVQGCLGDTIAQTTVRFADFNSDQEAVGVGLRMSVDQPAGLQLVICYAPRLVRRVDTGLASFKRAFASLGSGARKARVVEEEYGEDLALYAALPADALPKATLRAYLRGGAPLRRLLDRR